jgi:hypothetical protein
MENKQTAVEWFAERIQSDFIFNFENVLNQAKQMEKDQKLDFASKVLNKAECSWTGIVHINESLEDIYNEIHGKQII